MRPMLVSVFLIVGLAPASHAQRLLEEQRREEARRHHAAGEERMTREAFEEAVREFRAAIALDPTLFLAHYGLGQACMALKRYPEAIEAYRGARDTILRQASLDQHARAELDRRRRDEIRELEDSLQHLRSGHVKQASPTSEMALEERIRVLKDADRGALESAPRVPAELSLALGSAHYRLGQLEPAEREYRAAIAVEPGHGGAHNNLAVVCMMTGRLEEARDELERAEKAGFRVSSAFKKDLQARISSRAK
ncbi:MAG TPA: tetratricopeptide repeat protein [Vicinamibacteria bacterium]|nr:tetratricopeptide repeat protein [Vicinamibacteria bacterium]